MNRQLPIISPLRSCVSQTTACSDGAKISAHPLDQLRAAQQHLHPLSYRGKAMCTPKHVRRCHCVYFRIRSADRMNSVQTCRQHHIKICSFLLSFFSSFSLALLLLYMADYLRLYEHHSTWRQHDSTMCTIVPYSRSSRHSSLSLSP